MSSTADDSKSEYVTTAKMAFTETSGDVTTKYDIVKNVKDDGGVDVVITTTVTKGDDKKADTDTASCKDNAAANAYIKEKTGVEIKARDPDAKPTKTEKMSKTLGNTTYLVTYDTFENGIRVTLETTVKEKDGDTITTLRALRETQVLAGAWVTDKLGKEAAAAGEWKVVE